MIFDCRNQYSFLSNFYTYNVTYKEITYANNISAFYAQFYNDARKKLFAKTAPNEAVRLFDTKTHDFDLSQEEQIIIMKQLCEIKFADDLKDKLLATGNEELLYTTDWKDKFWGVYDNEGENHLGKILMEIRNSITTEPNEITNTTEIIDDNMEEVTVDVVSDSVDEQESNIEVVSEEETEEAHVKNNKKKNKK